MKTGHGVSGVFHTPYGGCHLRPYIRQALQRLGVAAGTQRAGSLPEGAVRASLGCGDPVAVAGLRAEETVLDLG